MKHYDKWNYWLNIGISTDKWGNSFSGGSHNNTISARVGDYSNRKGVYSLFWCVLEWIINFAFYPVDGPEHCYKAFKKEKEDSTFREGNWLGRIVLMPIVVIVCILIGSILWTIKPIVKWFNQINYS